MPNSGEIAQRFKECGGKQENEQALSEAQLMSPCTKAKRPEQMKADVNRYHSDAKSCEELKNG
ncbi:hypothetical protein D9M69_555100 [compost metagenome]